MIFLFTIYFLIPAALLLLGIADMPSGYYTLLRIYVCLFSVLIAYNSYEKNGVNLTVILFGAIALLFNPIIPVYLYDKEIWIIIDIVCAVLFIIKGLIYRVTDKI